MKQFRIICLLVFVFSVVTCMSATVSIAQEKVITIKVANWFPVGSKHDLILQEWGKDLEKRAGGKVKVNYYAAGTLVPAAQSYDAVVKGIADVGNHVLGYTMGRFPFSQVLDLPIGWPQGPEATKIANDFYKKFNPKEFDDVKVLLFHGQPGGYLHTKTRPVEKLEDAKGLKLRCFGSNAKFVGLIGAAPVAMPMPDVYDALAKGVVDGLMSSYEALHNFRTGEHVKYSTENVSSAYSAVFIVMMNKKKFASLPPDVQAIVDKMSVEYIDKYGKLWADITRDGKDWLVKRGVKVISLSKEEQARWYEKGSKPLVEAYIKDAKEKGLPGDEAVKFLLDSIRKYH
ncbi:MAG: TRAP transporter substrate-binding protein [Proteobacteria bacterium]|nr:TRAP transporter substrate-binding protein [Pseudomonadota bacterium]